MARIRPAASELCFDEESERVVEVASIEEVLENAGGLGITAEPYAGRFGWGTLIRLNGKPTLLTDVDHAAVQGAMAAKRCARYRRRILDISQRVSALHIAPAFSCMEITDYVYSALMRPADVFLMSKGHGCIAQYAVLEDRGVIPGEEMDRYCTMAGTLGAHPDRGTPGIVASTGSLGHGLGLAVGMAYAARIKGEDCNVYVVMSDGELQEGSTWEAVQMAANLGLTNLAVFVDLNDFGGLERLSDAHHAVYPVAEKFGAFGWEARRANGHELASLQSALAGRSGGLPFAVVCGTVKGKGVSYMENVPIWHYRSPNAEEYRQALRELEANA